MDSSVSLKVEPRGQTEVRNETVRAHCRNNFGSAKAIEFAGQPMAGDAIGPVVGLGVIGYIVGGIVAAILNIDEVYDLSHVSNTVRVAVILRIFHRGGITAEDSR